MFFYRRWQRPLCGKVALRKHLRWMFPSQVRYFSYMLMFFDCKFLKYFQWSIEIYIQINRQLTTYPPPPGKVSPLPREVVRRGGKLSGDNSPGEVLPDISAVCLNLTLTHTFFQSFHSRPIEISACVAVSWWFNDSPREVSAPKKGGKSEKSRAAKNRLGSKVKGRVGTTRKKKWRQKARGAESPQKTVMTNKMTKNADEKS